MNKLLIVDGNNLLFQMFYGIPSKIYNKSGDTIHATLGFISCIQKIIKTQDITHAVVVFDDDTSQARVEEYQDYKKNRFSDWDSLAKDEVPFNEETKIVKCLEYLGIRVLYSKKMEADDLIATICKLFDRDVNIIISSFDSDFFQLINDNVSILRYRGKNTKIYDEKYFYEEFGFKPSRYVLYKALVGDSADNIKGIDKIGKVRGRLIAQNISSIDRISTIPDGIIHNNIKENIVKNYNIVKRNIKLIELNKKEDIDYQLDEFQFSLGKIKLKNSEILSACKIFD